MRLLQRNFVKNFCWEKKRKIKVKIETRSINQSSTQSRSIRRNPQSKTINQSIDSGRSNVATGLPHWLCRLMAAAQPASKNVKMNSNKADPLHDRLGSFWKIQGRKKTSGGKRKTAVQSSQWARPKRFAELPFSLACFFSARFFFSPTLQPPIGVTYLLLPFSWKKISRHQLVRFRFSLSIRGEKMTSDFKISSGEGDWIMISGARQM